MERTELRLDAAAKEAGVLVVSSCGFDSIPADMGVIFACDTLRNAGVTPSAVESFLTLKSGPKVGWKHRIKNRKALQALPAVEVETVV